MNIGKKLALFFIRSYQIVISPFLGQNCRFYPSCSHYAEEAVIKKGILQGAVLSFKRLMKCHPFYPGGIDVLE